MGIFASRVDNARRGAEPRGAIDRVKARRWNAFGRWRGVLGPCLAFFLGATACLAEPLRIALFHTELNRKAPGLLYRDIVSGAPDIAQRVDRIVQAHPDVLVLLGFDYDFHGLALTAFAHRIRDAGGPDFRHQFALHPNTGLATGLDLDGDGRLGTPRDAQGFGRYSGEGGMAVLSRIPIGADAATDFSQIIWSELPWARLPQVSGAPFYDEQTQRVLRLSSVGHWVVPIEIGGSLDLLVFHATPPVFDGPEDRNGFRNADEIRFWAKFLDGPHAPSVVIGDANQDPDIGEGQRDAIQSSLAHPDLADPLAGSPTVDWSGIDLGLRRVDYILPTKDLTLAGSGLVWPEDDTSETSRHALIWVDLVAPP